ncbi:hypothetical protein LLEC1_00839 [Akanthomyces lecanii]|uniref:NACHT domain-containing protein n=1 Tax=Cordyceps confragosa TaxID=2714763 RepID=A0A179I5E0_CORDF|nr:hypothetical protein LLEC1_00839 [Akanthomyces lecanii]
MSPKKKDTGRTRFAGFWNKLLRKGGSQQGKNCQGAHTTNPQTEGDTLEPHEPTLVERPGVSQTSEQDSADSDSLWDQAYSALEIQDHRGIFGAYNSVLIKIYKECTRIPKSSVRSWTLTLAVNVKGSSDQAVELPSMHNARQHREVLDTVANLGLQQMEDKEIARRLWGHEFNLQNTITNAASVIGPIQKIVQAAVKDLPYAAVIMAGTAEADHREGFDYVTSQIRYYLEMETLFLPLQMEDGVRTQLKLQIKSLYEKIIDYEVRSVLHFFSSRSSKFFRGSILFDDWKGKLTAIQELENTVQERLSLTVSGESMGQLMQLRAEAEAMRQNLDSIAGEVHTLVSVVQRMEQLSLSKENRELLEALRAVDPRLAKKALQTAKETPQLRSYEWILSDDDFQQWQNDEDKHVLWISGDPGKGKTMLLCGIIDQLMETKTEELNVAFFLCQSTDASFNTAAAAVRSLLWMLVKQQPELVSYIGKSCEDGMGSRRFDGVTAWEAVREVFVKVLDDPDLRSTYIIIDALDECVERQQALVELILDTATSKRAKWLVSSRKDLIWPSFGDDHASGDPDVTVKRRRRIKFELEEKKDSISTSIKNYIENAVDHLKRQKGLSNTKADLVKERLALNAEGTFLWVALVCKALADPEVLNGDIEQELNLFPKGLHDLYKQMLTRIQKSRHKKLCTEILAIACAVFRPVTLAQLRSLSSQELENYEDADLQSLVVRCGSFLTLEDKTISFVHKSAKDYLRARPGQEIVASGWARQHYMLFRKSLEILTSTLRRDLCGLQFLGPLAERDPPPDLTPLHPISYSALFWMEHFRSSALEENSDLDMQKAAANLVFEFFQEKYLYWLEALSLLKSLSNLVKPLRKLTRFMASLSLERNENLLHDATRFLLEHKAGIEVAPMQVYVSALLLSPSGSLIKQAFSDKAEEPEWLKIERGFEEKWDVFALTLDGHTNRVRCVAYSHDSQRLASGSEDGTIKMWDASTGDCLLTIKVKCIAVWSVAFSHDSRQLLSTCQDTKFTSGSGLANYTINVWDSSSGHMRLGIPIQNIHCPKSSTGFSYDSQRLTLVTRDTVQIRNAQTGDCLREVQPPSGKTVAVSYDGKVLSVQIWDVLTGDCLHILKCHGVIIEAVKFSGNNQKLGSVSDDGIVDIWDTRSGSCLQTFPTFPNLYFTPFAFSHDIQHVAVSYISSIKTWDIHSSDASPTYSRHKDHVQQVIIFNNGRNFVTVSNDTMKLWDAASGDCLNAYEGMFSFSKWAHNQRQLVFAEGLELIVLDVSSSELNRSAQLRVPVEHEKRERGLSEVYTRIATSLDGQKVVLVCGSSHPEFKIIIWDVKSGAYLPTLGDHEWPVEILEFSPDGRQFVSVSMDRAVRVWSVNSGECVMAQTTDVAAFQCSIQCSVAFSHDGRRLASSSERTIKVWDIESKSCLVTLEGSPNQIEPSVALSNNGSHVASWSEGKTVKVWDVLSGVCLLKLFVGNYNGKLSFDPQDNSRLFTGAGTLDINWRAAAETHSSTEKPSRSTPYLRCGISEDERWIEYRGKKVFWIPIDFTPLKYAVEGSRICVGCENGRVWFATFTSEQVGPD